MPKTIYIYEKNNNIYGKSRKCRDISRNIMQKT